MSGAPVRAPTNIDIQRHVKSEGRFGRRRHDAPDHLRRLFLAPLWHFKHQLVVDLEEHLHACEPGLLERLVHPRHRPLDQVGAGALDGCVDRGALGTGADRRVGRANVRLEMGLPPEQGLGETMLPRECQRSVRERTDARKALVIAIDDGLASFGTPSRPAMPQAELP